MNQFSSCGWIEEDGAPIAVNMVGVNKIIFRVYLSTISDCINELQPQGSLILPEKLDKVSQWILNLEP